MNTLFWDANTIIRLFKIFTYMIDEKLNKELQATYNPDGSELKLLQTRMVDMLEYFDKFCKENNIKYWLSSGSCLGAIRHGGFIPWDDDMDIEMLKEDYDKFLSLRDRFESEDFVIQDYHSDDEYITPYPKLRDKKSEVKENHNRDKYFKYKGVFIDVFMREENCYASLKISHIAQYIAYLITDIRNNRVRKKIKKVVYWGLNKVLYPFLKNINFMFCKKNIMYFGLGYGFYIPIDYEWIFPLKDVNFENVKFPVPAKSDEYLSRLYGDYMKIPQKKADFKQHFTSIKINNN